MLIDTGPIRMLGAVDHPRLRFDEVGRPSTGGPGRRYLLLADEPAFELSFWCGTCPVLFKRLRGANERLSLPELAQTLSNGVDQVDECVVEAFAELLPHGAYLPMLTQIEPRPVQPRLTGDYFSEEQMATWGPDPFWGLPEYPQTPYYRTWETRIDANRHLFEFIVPMVPPSWNDQLAVHRYEDVLAASDAPTAVAVSILDVCAPATFNPPANDYFTHWGLMHFLLDGHHKMQAAAESARSIRLLSLVSMTSGLSTVDQVERLPDLRRRSAERRG